MSNAGQILRLAGANYLQNVAEHHRDVATKQLNLILDAAESFNTELAAVVADTKLTPEGRVAHSTRVAAAALTKLAMVETDINTLTERAATLEKTLLQKMTLTPPKDPAERVAYELRLQEIRGQLRELPASERLNIYRTTQDPVMLAAIESAPMSLSPLRPDGSRRLEPFVDLEQMTAVKLERAKKEDVATSTRLSEVQGLREIYSHAVNGVKKEILDEVSMNVANPLNI